MSDHGRCYSCGRSFASCEDRIRELEAENAELHKELDGFALMQRITKAKAILEEYWYGSFIERALDALEEK